MCGIAGIIAPSQPQHPVLLRNMINAITHRGPDGLAYWSNQNADVNFAHCRLSIIDLSSAASQPMSYLGRYTIIHNGEIYNYIELREELRSKGLTFHTESDTEVILASYHQWKQDCVQHLDGMFSFAIWDEESQTLFAARDRFGQKPFYYGFDSEGAFYFSSEIKALRTANIDTGINEKLLLLFITLGSTNLSQHPEQTFYKSIFQLPHASFLEYSPLSGSRELHIRKYWDLKKNEKAQLTDKDAIERFRELFNRSVMHSFRADVIVGTCLSGGLDSSSILATASRLRNQQNSYKAFSVIFPGYEKDESWYSALVAKENNVQQFTTTPTEKDFLQDFDHFIHLQDEPVSSSSAYAQYKLFQLAKQEGIKVLLDGQGADELLGGYTRYIHWYLQELVVSQPGRLNNELKRLKSNHLDFAWGFRNYLAAFMPSRTAQALKLKAMNAIRKNTDLSNEFVHARLSDDILTKPVVRGLNDILYFNAMQSGLHELLRYADRNSMANGCEVRLPFLDHKLAEFIFSLPSTMKIRNGFTKWILRKSAEPILPAEITWRKDKIGFEPPQKAWMATEEFQNLIMQAKEKLVNERILSTESLHKKVQPHDAHAAEALDWRYLAAGFWLLQ